MEQITTLDRFYEAVKNDEPIVHADCHPISFDKDISMREACNLVQTKELFVSAYCPYCRKAVFIRDLDPGYKWECHTSQCEAEGPICDNEERAVESANIVTPY